MRRSMRLMRSTNSCRRRSAFILLGVVALADVGRGFAARPGARRPRRGRRLRGAAAGRIRPSRIIGRSISTSRSSPRPLLRWRGRGCGPGLRSRRSCSARYGRCREPTSFPSRRIGAHVFNALAGFALAAVFLVCGLLYGPPAKPGEVDWLSTLALSVYLVVAAFLVLASRHDSVALTAFVILTAATVAIAWRTEAAAGAVPVAAILAAVVMADWAVADEPLQADRAVRAGRARDPRSAALLSTDRTFCLPPHGRRCSASPDSWRKAVRRARWCRCCGAPRPCSCRSPMLIALYYRIAALDRSLPFAGLALLLAAIFAVATETLVRREPRPGLMASSAMFATGALAALALALTFALEKGWLTIGLALMAPGAAWVAEKRPLPALRWLAAIMVAVTARAHRLRAAHRRRRPRHDADLQLAALWLRRSGAVILARRDGCCGGAPMICRRASSMPAPSCSRCCW